MIDIVERLHGFADTEMPVEALAIVCEAADEIERLLAENAALAADKVEERANRYWEGRYRDEAADNDRLREFNTKLCDEIERLRGEIEDMK